MFLFALSHRGGHDYRGKNLVSVRHQRHAWTVVKPDMRRLHRDLLLLPRHAPSVSHSGGDLVEFSRGAKCSIGETFRT